MGTKTEQYKWVNHLGEAAALQLLGHQVLTTRINPFNNLRVQTQFGFEDSQEVAMHSKMYWDGTVQVNAKDYYEASNLLRKTRYDLEKVAPVTGQELEDNLNNLRN